MQQSHGNIILNIQTWIKDNCIELAYLNCQHIMLDHMDLSAVHMYFCLNQQNKLKTNIIYVILYFWPHPTTPICDASGGQKRNTLSG